LKNQYALEGFFLHMLRNQRCRLSMQWRRLEFESGGMSGTKRRNFCRAPPLFWLYVQLVVLMGVFVMVITVWSVSCLLFFYSRCPCAQLFVKVGACTSCLMESTPLLVWMHVHCM